MGEVPVVGTQTEVKAVAQAEHERIRVWLTFDKEVHLHSAMIGTALVRYREVRHGRGGLWELNPSWISSSALAVDEKAGGRDVEFTIDGPAAAYGFVDTKVHGCMVIPAVQLQLSFAHDIWVGFLRPDMRKLNVSAEKEILTAGDGINWDVVATIESGGDRLNCFLSGRADNPADVQLFFRRKIGPTMVDSVVGTFEPGRSVIWMPSQPRYEPVLWVFSSQSNARDLCDALRPLGYTGNFEYGSDETFVVGDSPEMEYEIALRHTEKKGGLPIQAFEDVARVTLNESGEEPGPSSPGA